MGNSTDHLGTTLRQRHAGVPDGAGSLRAAPAGGRAYQVGQPGFQCDTCRKIRAILRTCTQWLPMSLLRGQGARG